MTFSGIQIYLIIGLLFAQGGKAGCARAAFSFLYFILRRTLWTDLIGEAVSFRTLRGGGRWRRAPRDD